jgi:hypothetical protein
VNRSSSSSLIAVAAGEQELLFVAPRRCVDRVQDLIEGKRRESGSSELVGLVYPDLFDRGDALQRIEVSRRHGLVVA